MKKQIEKIAKLICQSRGIYGIESCEECGANNLCLYQEIAEALYNAGYRKHSDGERLQAQNADLNILVKDLRFRNKEFQKANKKWAEENESLEIELENMRRNLGDAREQLNDAECEIERLKKAYANYEETSGLKQAKAAVAREIFAEIESVMYNRHSIPFLGEDIRLCIAELKKKYTEN